MLTSSILNSLTCKDLSNGIYPNHTNTLHNDMLQGGLTTKCYYQKWPKGHVIYLQFTSLSADDITVQSYNPLLVSTVAVGYATLYTGVEDRYFFNIAITLDSNFHDKYCYFKFTQGSTALTSEPIYCTDISEELANGTMKYIQYSNSDRNNSDLSDYWIDWSNVGSTGNYMDLFVDGLINEPNISDQSEIIDGAQTKTTVYAKVYTGGVFKLCAVPIYMCEKLAVIFNIDTFTINGIRFIKDGSIEIEQFGLTTLHQISVTLTEKYTIGLNVDDIGIELTEAGEMMKSDNRDNVVSDYDIEIPDGYMIHTIYISHAPTSSMNQATVTAGLSYGADSYIDAMGGQIDSSKVNEFPIHSIPNLDSSSRLYFGITGTSIVLRIYVQFISIS